MVQSEGELVNYPDLTESRVQGVEEDIGLGEDDRRGNRQRYAALLDSPAIAVTTALPTQGIGEPVVGNLFGVLDETIGNVQTIRDQIVREIVRFEMDQDFENGQR